MTPYLARLFHPDENPAAELLLSVLLAKPSNYILVWIQAMMIFLRKAISAAFVSDSCSKPVEAVRSGSVNTAASRDSTGNSGLTLIVTLYTAHTRARDLKT